MFYALLCVFEAGDGSVLCFDGSKLIGWLVICSFAALKLRSLLRALELKQLAVN